MVAKAKISITFRKVSGGKFTVVVAVNTTEFSPRQTLTKDQVDALILRGVTVTIK